jgi:DnaK suppressor protein
MPIAVAESIDRDTIRDLLQARRRDLIEKLHARVAYIREDGSNATPPKETDEAEAGDINVELLEILSTMLGRVESAIVALDNGLYGWCTRCRDRISEARLRAVPFAVRCRECEASREGEAGPWHAVDSPPSVVRLLAHRPPGALE